MYSRDTCQDNMRKDWVSKANVESANCQLEFLKCDKVFEQNPIFKWNNGR